MQAQDLTEELDGFERKVQTLLSTSQAYADGLANLQSAQHAFFDSLAECGHEASTSGSNASAQAGAISGRDCVAAQRREKTPQEALCLLWITAPCKCIVTLYQYSEDLG